MEFREAEPITDNPCRPSPFRPYRVGQVRDLWDLKSLSDPEILELGVDPRRNLVPLFLCSEIRNAGSDSEGFDSPVLPDSCRR